MHQLLELYQEARTPKLPARQFRELVGDVVAEALLSADVLTRGAVATTYPCHMSCHGCPRRIVRNFGHAVFPWVAVCGQQSPACNDVPLGGDLEAYQLSHESFASKLRQLMGLDGAFQMLDSTYPDTVQLGELRAPEGVCEVFLSLGRWGWSCSLATLLAERLSVLRRSIVFAPTPRGIPAPFIHRYGGGGHVVLGFLANVLDGRAGHLALTQAFERLVRSRPEAVPVFCIAYTSEGTRQLSRDEYEKLVQSAHDLDLFLDVVVPRHGRKYAGGYRRGAGPFVQVEISTSEARALAELVVRGVTLAPRELASLKAVGGRAKIVQSARKKVDVRLRRYEWRAFHTAVGEGAEERRYVFRPPPTLRYAVLTSTE